MAAPNIIFVTINFDSHISKVAYNVVEWTTSGQEVQTTAVDGETGEFTVTLNNGYVLDTVTLGDDFSNATLSAKTDTSFSILFGNTGGGTITITSKQSTPRLSVDVSTLAGWANLSAGGHSITIVAKASGFKDSAPSAAVQVTKAASTKTLAAGTYKWIHDPNLHQFNENVNFTSNGVSYTLLSVLSGKRQIVYVGASGEEIVYFEPEWSSENYQTITLAADQQVSADFYEWAITGGNLVKQSDRYNITVTSFFAESGGRGNNLVFIGINRVPSAVDYDYKFVTNGTSTPIVTDKNGSTVTAPIAISGVTSIAAEETGTGSNLWFNVKSGSNYLLRLTQSKTSGSYVLTENISDMSWIGSYDD